MHTHHRLFFWILLVFAPNTLLAEMISTPLGKTHDSFSIKSYTGHILATGNLSEAEVSLEHEIGWSLEPPAESSSPSQAGTITSQALQQYQSLIAQQGTFLNWFQPGNLVNALTVMALPCNSYMPLPDSNLQITSVSVSNTGSAITLNLTGNNSSGDQASGTMTLSQPKNRREYGQFQVFVSSGTTHAGTFFIDFGSEHQAQESRAEPPDDSTDQREEQNEPIASGSSSLLCCWPCKKSSSHSPATGQGSTSGNQASQLPMECQNLTMTTTYKDFLLLDLAVQLTRLSDTMPTLQ